MEQNFIHDCPSPHRVNREFFQRKSSFCLLFLFVLQRSQTGAFVNSPWQKIGMLRKEESGCTKMAKWLSSFNRGRKLWGFMWSRNGPDHAGIAQWGKINCNPIRIEFLLDCYALSRVQHSRRWRRNLYLSKSIKRKDLLPSNRLQLLEYKISSDY